MNQSPNWFYTYVLPLLPLILTIGGWHFVAKQENKRRGHERRWQRIDAAIRLIAEIETNSIKYYCSRVEESDSLSVEITFNLQRLAKMCSKISEKGDLEINDFRIAVSGGDFQSKKRKILKENDSQIYQIRKAAFELSLKLDNYYD